jgi:hypothetical protein
MQRIVKIHYLLRLTSNSSLSLFDIFLGLGTVFDKSTSQNPAGAALVLGAPNKSLSASAVT